MSGNLQPPELGPPHTYLGYLIKQLEIVAIKMFYSKITRIFIQVTNKNVYYVEIKETVIGTTPHYYSSLIS